MAQGKLIEEKDEFVESLNLTPEKIKQDMEQMKSIEGFPIGDDEDILALSNPPYYTAYPNPYTKAFIEKYGKPYDEATDEYHREPYVSDVSEGKNGAVYNAHSYHTKVPHKAIMKFISHYTEPGDIVFDGFCGTGMTAVAAQQLNRRAVLSELSPAATFLSMNFNNPTDWMSFEDDARQILAKIEENCGWAYETTHSDGRTKGKINYTIWSDIMICPFCSQEYVYWDIAFDSKKDKVLDNYSCPSCQAEIPKKKITRAYEKIFDSILGKEIKQAKRVPVLINYSIGKKRYEKRPDANDLNLIKSIGFSGIPYWFPIREMPYGYNTQQPKKSHGISRIHHFYTPRNLHVMSVIYELVNNHHFKLLLFGFLNTAWHATLMRRYNSRGGDRPLTGTLYVPSVPTEANMIEVYRHKIQQLVRFLKARKAKKGSYFITTQSSTQLSNIPESSFDYIFTDPPFGGNLMYSELNYLWESWLKAFTNNNKEAIVNNTQNKGIDEYRELMFSCFREFYRVLKPNRWMTVEFHNSKAEIWKIIQESIVKSGFVIGQVAVLDKKQGSFKQVTTAGSVKNDLVINAYKPSQEFTDKFLGKVGINMERDFIDMHLDKLPIEPNVERTQQMLFSKLLAQYIQNGFEVRMDASEFYGMLRNHFVERDGYWFIQEQIPEYEKRLKLAKNIGKADPNQLLLFVTDEKSTIIWLSQFLRQPRTYSEIYTEWTQKWNERQDKMPELRDILEENFVTEEGKWRLPSIGEKKEKEDIRERRLSREFQDILQQSQSGKKIKEVRKEALLHGLMKLYNERDVDVIKLLGRILDKRIIESDDDIYAIIDWASTKED